MIAGLILAAGESSRMGTEKALLTYRARTFIETNLATLREAGVTRLAVALGRHADEIQRAVDFKGVSNMGAYMKSNGNNVNFDLYTCSNVRAEQTRVFISKVAAGLGLSDDRAPTGPAALAA